jgi:hypothetical protein
MSVVRARDEHAALWIRIVEEAHDVLATSDGAQRIAIGDGLAEHAQVGAHARDRLVAATARAEAGLHLVEAQQRSVPVAQRTQSREVAGRRGQHPDVLQRRLGEHAGHGVPAQHVLDRGEVAPVHDVHASGDALRDPCGEGEEAVLARAHPRAERLERG